ncbi:hypothetical protein H5410_002981 [Solanum commersonii]|uniref:Uncharacterized protein n=1 Tax=Solanum commersonii TaxID=4109 RepID=A0A9J6B3R0_SOLCO|nr:hypothetical protein H5410_002981 [Solanum commersonii]
MVRGEMQKLNKDEFMGVSDIVQMLRRELINKQINMRVIPIPQNMIDMEKILRAELANWSQREDDICDANTAYFFASMKGRKSQNQINTLTEENGTIIRELANIIK